MQQSKKKNKQERTHGLSGTHLSLRQLLLVYLLDLGAVGQQVAQFHVALPQLLVPAAATAHRERRQTAARPSVALPPSLPIPF